MNMWYMKKEGYMGGWTAGYADGVDELNLDFCTMAWVSGMWGSWLGVGLYISQGHGRMCLHVG